MLEKLYSSSFQDTCPSEQSQNSSFIFLSNHGTRLNLLALEQLEYKKNLQIKYKKQKKRKGSNIDL